MNHYYSSDGTRYKKSIIDKKIKIAKAHAIENQLTEYGFNHCKLCKVSSGTYFDCSHRVSVNEAQKSSRVELAWSVDNIDVLCRECHKKRDKLI